MKTLLLLIAAALLSIAPVYARYVVDSTEHFDKTLKFGIR